MKSQKFDFENPFGNIFFQVYAQDDIDLDVDAIAGPTLPIDENLSGPLYQDIDNTEPTPTEIEDSVSVNLTPVELSTEYSVDEEFEIELKVQSNESAIIGFELIINYNVDKLQSLDIEYIDEYFILSAEPEINDIDGIIKINAEALDDARTINRSIAKMKFKALNEGVGNITINTEQSSVNSDTFENLLKNTADVTVLIGEGDTIITPITVTQPPTVTEEITPIVSELPKNDLDTQSILPIAAGLLFILLGVITTKIAHSKEEM